MSCSARSAGSQPASGSRGASSSATTTRPLPPLPSDRWRSSRRTPPTSTAWRRRSSGMRPTRNVPDPERGQRSSGRGPRPKGRRKRWKSEGGQTERRATPSGGVSQRRLRRRAGLTGLSGDLGAGAHCGTAFAPFERDRGAWLFTPIGGCRRAGLAAASQEVRPRDRLGVLAQSRQTDLTKPVFSPDWTSFNFPMATKGCSGDQRLAQPAGLGPLRPPGA